MSVVVYDSYSILVAAAMKNEKHAEHWYKWLRMKRARENAEKDIIKEFRGTHPGLANSEILSKCSVYLENNFPVPKFPYIVEIKSNPTIA